MPEQISGWRATLRLRVESPLHVGTGDVLRAPWLEYARRGDCFARLDIASFLGNQRYSSRAKEAYFSLSKEQVSKLLDGLPGGRRRPNEPPSPDSLPNRYLMGGGPGCGIGGEVREAIKLSGDLPYLPGSSIKGALRTATAWKLFTQVDTGEREYRLRDAGDERREKFKAQSLENAIFRSGSGRGQGDAKEDALKALIIRDSAPLTDSLELRRYTLGIKHGSRLDTRGEFSLEALKTGTVIEVEILCRTDFLRAEPGYKPSESAARLLRDPRSLGAALTEHSAALCKVEEEFYQAAGHASAARFFRGRSDLLAIGFGTGWNTKTLGQLIGAEGIRDAGIRFYKGSPPPISRELCLIGDRELWLPPGWVSFTLETAGR
jgi:CRISPR-associated protein Csm5